MTERAVAAGSGTAKAVHHAFTGPGMLPIDNNPVENTAHPIAIGKKNWLLTCSERAGNRAASVQRLLAAA